MYCMCHNSIMGFDKYKKLKFKIYINILVFIQNIMAEVINELELWLVFTFSHEDRFDRLKTQFCQIEVMPLYYFVRRSDHAVQVVFLTHRQTAKLAVEEDSEKIFNV